MLGYPFTKFKILFPVCINKFFFYILTSSCFFWLVTYIRKSFLFIIVTIFPEFILSPNKLNKNPANQ